MWTGGGLDDKEIVPGKSFMRDTRTIGMKFHDFVARPRNIVGLLIGCAAASFILMSFADLIFVVCFGFFLFAYTRKQQLPFRLPKRAGIIDYNDLKPGTKQPVQARGITFYGNNIITNEELWFNDTDMRTHTLIFGSTGSGKTESMVSLAFNALIQGSGFIYVDGKGDNTLFAKIYSLARAVGREDDVLVINFMTGARDIAGPQERRLSNTMNPFSHGSSSMLSQLVVSLMAQATHTPDGDMWKGRAISFVEALMKVLVYMRDKGKILLDANTVRNYFMLDRLETIAIDRMFPREGLEPVSLADAPETVLQPILHYVLNLPGYNKEKKGKQVSQVLEQHGFITMQLTRVFTSLADTYGHILRTNLAEVDLKDVVLNRRILIVLLPALEKSPDELANLGKIIIASLKTMMAAGLGEEVEGEYKDLILRKPTNCPSPYMCILDEYGYYAVPGFAVVPAQARSLGFSVVFAGQDLPAFQRASKEEAASIGANTNIKIAMKIEDSGETWDFFQKTSGGSAWVTKVSDFQLGSSGLAVSYRGGTGAQASQSPRIIIEDMKNQREGEAHIFFRAQIVRARMFFANPKPVQRMQLNQFLRIDKPVTRKLIGLEQLLDQFSGFVDKKDFGLAAPEFNQDINLLAETLKNDKAPTLIERGVAALLAFHHRYTEIVEEEEEEVEEVEDELDVFSKTLLPDMVREFVPKAEFEQFSMPILNKTLTNQKIEYLERLFGQSEKKAYDVASEMVMDMQLATNYPPIVEEEADIEELVDLIKELSESFEKMKE